MVFCSFCHKEVDLMHFTDYCPNNPDGEPEWFCDAEVEMILSAAKDVIPQ